VFIIPTDKYSAAANEWITVAIADQGRCFGCLKSHMKKFVWCLLAIAALVASAFPQIPHGSIGVVYYSDDKIVMAADSREIHTEGEGPADTYCKIAAFSSKLVFVSSGSVEYAPVSLGDPIHA